MGRASERNNRLWYGKNLDNHRRVMWHVRDGAGRVDRTFASPEDAAKFVQRERPRGFNLYWLVDNQWTTEGCPPLPDLLPHCSGGAD